MTPRSLADDLRQRDEASLALLLRRRPDLSHPVPQDITALAARATTGPSLSRCLDALNLVALHLLALTAQLSRDTPTTVEAVLKGRLDQRLAMDTLADLRTLALIWGPDTSLRVVTGVHDLLASMPRTSDEVPLTEPAAWQPVEVPGPARGTIAASIARRFVLGVDVLMESWGQRPVRELAKGGLPAKDLANLQDLLEWEAPAVVLALEVARAARLITRDADHRWLPTQQFDRWRTKEVGQRWVTLFEAWLDLPKIATAPQVVPLDDTHSPGVIAVRRASLEIMAQAPPEATVPVDGVCAVLDFRLPRRRGQVRNQMVQASLFEADLLGVLIDGRLTKAGRAALEPDRASAATFIEEDLPELAAEFFIQSDLTIIAPGPLPLSVEAMVRRIAQVESAEPATVARITAQSLTEAVSS
ncbi:MAG: helicase-associated domain-containing protein, partial [Actinomycetales bacterium]